jgi:sarcosine oxidase
VEVMETTKSDRSVTTHDVAVIGAGMMGSAAAKYLAISGRSVLLLGAEEGNDEGVHASHYDQARITRFSGPDRIWSHLAAKSIEAYPEIEATSGIRFHQGSGHLRCDLPAIKEASLLDHVREVLDEMPIAALPLTADQSRERFPFLHFAPDARLHYEPAPAGIIAPRALVRAQIAIARSHGARVEKGVALRLEKEGGSFVIHTGSGAYSANNVLLATGPYTSLMPLAGVELPLTVKTESVLLARVNPREQSYLMEMPGIIWNFDHRDDLPYAYILPPVRYEDGHHYLKFGADHDRDIDVKTVADYDQYMQSEGSSATAGLLREVLIELIPELSEAPIKSKPCLLTYTPKGYPLIDQLEDGLFIAAGGCGKSAKSSDMLGRLAAYLVSGKTWPEPFARQTFSVS